MRKGTLLLTALMVSGVVTACGGGDSKPVNTTPAQETTTQSTTTAAETTTVAETTPAETEASEATPMGQEATLDDWNITVNNMQILDVIPNGVMQFEPDSGNKFLVITLNAANNGKEADRFLPSFGMSDDTSAKVIYGDGYEFSQTNLLGYDKSMIDSTINPLSSKEGDIVFEIPESVSSSTEPLILEISTGTKKTNFTVR